MSDAAPTRRGLVARWLAWSPVAAVLWAALALSLAGIASGFQGCDPASPIGPDDPPGPAPKPRPDWIFPDDPNKPDPPQPHPRPYPSGLPAGWETRGRWIPFDRSTGYHGSEAFVVTVDGVDVMTHIRPRRSER